MRQLVAPHLEDQAVEQYIRHFAGDTQTPLVQATRTVRYLGRVYVLVRRADGSALAIYRERPDGSLVFLPRPPRSLLHWSEVDVA